MAFDPAAGGRLRTLVERWLARNADADDASLTIRLGAGGPRIETTKRLEAGPDESREEIDDADDALGEIERYLQAQAVDDDGPLAEWGSEDALGTADLAAVAGLEDEMRARLDLGPVVRAFVTGHADLARATETRAAHLSALARALIAGDLLLVKALGTIARRLTALARARTARWVLGPGAGCPPRAGAAAVFQASCALGGVAGALPRVIVSADSGPREHSPDDVRAPPG